MTGSVTFQFEDFHRMDVPALNLEPQSRPYDMESLDSSSAGIDYQHIAAGITHDLQDMRMTAHKDVRPVFVYQRFGTGVIPPGVPADMGHQDLHALAFEEAVERVFETQVMVVAVARNAHQRLEGGYFLCHIHPPSEISGMPYLVDRLEELPELRVKDSVGI